MEKETVNANAKKERFEFKLTVNGNIICQRYFRINGFKRESYGSIDMIYAIDECVDMIMKDLKSKTQLYLEYTAPQIFKDVDEMKEILSNGNIRLNDMTFIAFEDSDDSYVYMDNKCIPYDKPISKTDYLTDENGTYPVVFKFAFYDDGVEIASKVWDGSVYPRFIRTNVDISNSRNKYRQENNFSPIEAFMIDKFNEDREDLIPKIVRVIYSTCSHQDAESYTSQVKYGDTVYDLDNVRARKKYYKKWEKAVQKKTDDYFKK